MTMPHTVGRRWGYLRQANAQHTLAHAIRSAIDGHDIVALMPDLTAYVDAVDMLTVLTMTGGAGRLWRTVPAAPPTWQHPASGGRLTVLVEGPA